MVDTKKLGQRLKGVRISRNLTQTQLAEAIGVTNNYVSNIERDHSIPSLETLVKICNILDITPDYVLVDSLRHGGEYIQDEIAKKLAQCNQKSVRLVSKFISLLIEEQE
jgi:transcriptional regulator with XRE-family HTH domain